jgi:catechol 2,3-dioxygenase-like lactoylglutathione lyase family enzyme
VSLHRLTHLKIGVPNLDEAATFYADFGLTPVQGPHTAAERRFSTVDGGEQLILVHSPVRRLVEIGVAAQDHDDLHSIQSRLARLDVDARVYGSELAAVEPATGIGVKIALAEPLQQKWQIAEQNYPGDIRRPDVRAPSLYRENGVRPRKLGHVVFGSTDYATTKRFFMEGLGFRISDEVQDIGAFMRCSPDHHNVLVQAAPVPFLHHTFCITRPGKSKTSTRSVAAHRICSQNIPSATCGASGATGSGRTSSGTSVIQRAI